jgi:hypothetical protein
LVVGHDLFILAIYHASKLDSLRVCLTVGIMLVDSFLDGSSETLPNIRRRHQH